MANTSIIYNGGHARTARAHARKPHGANTARTHARHARTLARTPTRHARTKVTRAQETKPEAEEEAEKETGTK